jgi:hypothetical protein
LKPERHKSWRLTVPGYPPFTMGGDECTEAEAIASAKLIWPKAEFKIAPASSRPTKDNDHE